MMCKPSSYVPTDGHERKAHSVATVPCVAQRTAGVYCFFCHPPPNDSKEKDISEVDVEISTRLLLVYNSSLKSKVVVGFWAML